MKINDIRLDSYFKTHGQTATSYSDVSGNEIEIQHRISENLADSTRPIFTKHDWNDFLEFQSLYAINYATDKKEKREGKKAFEEASTYDISLQEISALKAYYRHKTNDNKFLYFDGFEKTYAEIKSSI
jgi:hypothetical protein